jgi:hypothetical protein
MIGEFDYDCPDRWDVRTRGIPKSDGEREMHHET